MQPQVQQQGEDQGAQAFMNAFLKVVQESGGQVPEALQSFVPDQEREDLRKEQKLLNKIRNNRQKVQSKEKAIARDENQWKQWLEEVKATVSTQRQQHLDNQEKLKKELKDLMQEQERLRRIKETDGMEISEGEKIAEAEDVEEYLEQMIHGTTKEDKHKKLTPTVVEEDTEQVMQKKVQEMQEKLSQEFQAKLHQAQQAMEQQFNKRVLEEKQKMKQRMQQKSNENQVITVEDGLEGLDGVTEAAAMEVGYGAERQRHRPDSGPYSPSTGDKKSQTMGERLGRTHGIGDTGQNQ